MLIRKGWCPSASRVVQKIHKSNCNCNEGIKISSRSMMHDLPNKLGLAKRYRVIIFVYHQKPKKTMSVNNVEGRRRKQTLL